MSRPIPRQLAFVLAVIAPFIVAGISLGAVGEGIEQTVAPERRWSVDETLRDGSLIPLIDGLPQTGGVVNRSYGLAKLDPAFDPLDGDGLATAKIFSNETGRTWWISSESQSGAAGRLGPEVGSIIEFEQLQGFRKIDATASLRLVFTKVFIDALDHNGFILPSECVTVGTDDEDLCSSVLWGSLDVTIKAWTGDHSLNYWSEGDVYLEGPQGDWRMIPNLDSGSQPLIWNASDFEIDRDVDGDGGLHAIARLRKPVVVDIPLNGPSGFPDGSPIVDEQEVFVLQIKAFVETDNVRGRESWLAVYLRDPVDTGGSATSGATIELTGLEPTSDFPRDPPADVMPTPAPCAAPDRNAGILRLEVAEPRRLEMHGARWQVVVSRTGGRHGAVSATLTSHDGSAIAGSDYEPLARTVAFADGDTGPRNLTVRVVTDTTFEPDEDLHLTLSDPGGCATLDDPSSVELTILDDDAPVTVPAIYTVGGTVTGLAPGATMVLEDHHGIYLEITENGPFTFSDFKTPSGKPYSVTVLYQPSYQRPEWIQFCTVTNGRGVFTDHDVTDVLVTCVSTHAAEHRSERRHRLLFPG